MSDPYQNDVFYLRTARERWPGYSISGAGHIAVVLECCRKIHLTRWALDAEAIASDRCCEDCSARIAPEGAWHKIIHLPEPTPAKPLRYTPDSERD